MSLFRKKIENMSRNAPSSQAILAEIVLNYINEGVVIIDGNGIVKLVNPAASRMIGYNNPADLVGLSYLSAIHLETGEGMPIPDNQNPLAHAAAKNTSFESRDYFLVSAQNNKIPISITLTPSGGKTSERIITFRNISQDLQKEGEQTEFISTASHEMRTPVASIEGYLGLALNPSTATIDDRARQYLTEAHNASQHLGKLFRDLLDVTRLDDKREKLHLVPVEVVSTVRNIASQHINAMKKKNLNFSFGSKDNLNDKVQIDQTSYAMVDVDFLQEIMNNLIENAIKYTDEGGSIWVNVRNDNENVLINVTDSGMGISPDNLNHIFQKFYRVDNSQTRTIGGTGLGLYIVKQRVEAMNGRVWAESEFGEGSTFYVSLPRISQEEYDRQQLVQRNTQMMNIQRPSQQSSNLAQATMIAFAPAPEPATTPVSPVSAPEPATTPVSSAPISTSQVTTPSAAEPSSNKQGIQPPSTNNETENATDLPADKLAELKQKFANQLKESSSGSTAPESQTKD